MNEEFFESPVDGIRLFRRTWTPPGRPGAVIAFAHGMMEHSGRHADWAERFAAERNIAVVAADARGHGRSEGRRAWVRDFDDFLDDYSQVLCDAARRFPGVPLFAMGFSMGGAIAALTVMTRAARIPELRGLILAAPAIRFRGKMFRPLYMAASVLDHLLPRVWVARPNYSILSRDRDHVADFEADPLVHHGVLLLHFGTEILKAMRKIQKRAPRFDLPLLMLQGTHDWVVTPSGAVDFAEAVSSPDKVLRLYDGFFHDLLHEPERDMVLENIVLWIEKRASM